MWKRGNAGLEGEETKERELEMYRDTQNMEFHFDIAFDGQIYYNELATSYHLVQRTVDVFVESSMSEISLGVWVRH
ncbi:MAG: hypothetical protein K6A93_07630 [Bacteroidaceae bacterium]|nr:hypothetical protein [Bacteroidaceae bacterium]